MPRLIQSTASRSAFPPLIILLSLVLAAGLSACAGLGDADGETRFFRFQILNELREIRESTIRDPRGPVHEARPMIYHKFYGGGH